jgi:flagellar biosynthetic protein FliP
MPPELIAAASSVHVNISGLKNPSTSVLIIIVLTVLAIAPSILVLMTGFTRVFICCR